MHIMNDKERKTHLKWFVCRYRTHFVKELHYLLPSGWTMQKKTKNMFGRWTTGTPCSSLHKLIVPIYIWIIRIKNKKSKTVYNLLINFVYFYFSFLFVTGLTFLWLRWQFPLKKNRPWIWYNLYFILEHLLLFSFC